jgi:hypothetical protein
MSQPPEHPRRRPLRWMLERLFGLRYSESHLSISGLAKDVQVLATIGLFCVAGILVLLVFPHLLLHTRYGDMWNMGGAGSPVAPGTLFIISLLLFPVAWILVIYGSLSAHGSVRIGVGVLYSLTYLWLGAAAPQTSQGHWTPSDFYNWIIPFSKIVVFVPAALLLASGLLAMASRLPRFQFGLGIGAAAASGVPFLAYLRPTLANNGGNANPFLMRFIIAMDIGALVLVPLALLATMSVVRIYYGVGEAVSWGGSRVPRAIAMLALLAFVAGEVWFLVIREWNLFSTQANYLWSFVQTIGILVAIAIVACACRSMQQTPSEIEVEHVRHYGALIAGTASVLVFLFACAFGAVQALAPNNPGL